MDNMENKKVIICRIGVNAETQMDKNRPGMATAEDAKARIMQALQNACVNGIKLSDPCIMCTQAITDNTPEIPESGNELEDARIVTVNANCDIQILLDDFPACCGADAEAPKILEERLKAYAVPGIRFRNPSVTRIKSIENVPTDKVQRTFTAGLPERHADECVEKFGEDEVLNILEEECAELIQACSKIHRAMKKKDKASLKAARKNLAMEIAHTCICIGQAAKVHNITEKMVRNEVNAKCIKHNMREIP